MYQATVRLKYVLCVAEFSSLLSNTWMVVETHSTERPKTRTSFFSFTNKLTPGLSEDICCFLFRGQERYFEESGV